MVGNKLKDPGLVDPTFDPQMERRAAALMAGGVNPYNSDFNEKLYGGEWPQRIDDGQGSHRGYDSQRVLLVLNSGFPGEESGVEPSARVLRERLKRLSELGVNLRSYRPFPNTQGDLMRVYNQVRKDLTAEIKV